MADRSSSDWMRDVASFTSSPKSFLLNVAAEGFVDDLLKDLKSGSLNELTKVTMLNLFLEFPTLLCPEKTSGDITTEILMNILQETPVKSITLRCHLLLAIETIQIATDNFNWNCKTAQEFASLLMHIISDVNDKKQGAANRPLRVTACECLRELENCYPGLLSQRLEQLYTLQQQEVSSAHQSYTILYSIALKNAIQLLAQKDGPANGALKQVLMSNDSFLWNATKDMKELRPASGEQLFLLPSNNETKELKSILALLLEDSYLLTPVCQNALFWQIIQVVAMVRTISPVIFKSQLVRLFGTMDISCFHSILQMKAVFTDSLFTAEDEHFLLQRLVGMTLHPLLSTPVKLFYLDCLLHFPENRPLNSNPGENLPVLLTVYMTSSLFPNIFNDCSTMLCRQNLLSMVYLENEGFHAERGIGFLYEHLMSLYSMVNRNASQEITATFFRAAYLFVRYFHFCEKHMENLTRSLLNLYKDNSTLAPYFINLIHQTQTLLEFQAWPVSLSKALQRQIVELPVNLLTLKNLPWHLKVLAKVAQENTIPQTCTIMFLRRMVSHSDLCLKGDWGLGNALLSVCKHILQHEHLHKVFMPLADLLQYLMHQFADIDIQDRSRFYYILLTNVSGDKLGKVLNMSPTDGQTKTRSLSSIMTESENFSTLLTIHNTKKTVLQLCPVLDHAKILPAHPEASTGGNKEADCSIEEHYQHLAHHRSSLLALKYHLTFKGDIEEKYQKLFCIVLQFDLTDSFYEPIGAINVPCLYVGRKPPVVMINVVPKVPHPSYLVVNATFSTQEGLTYHTQLDPLPISFPELFVPFLLPASCHLFDKLWHALKADDLKDNEESIFSGKMSESSLHDVVLSHFSKFVVSHHDHKYKIGIVLPPRSHILMCAQVQDDTAQFHIRTDNWKLLPFLNTHLLDVSSKT
ncbi:AP-5 complex subunit beta-1 [Dendropsophus ebraccatus]|uniref:AP-5 complex subunit beta-1 n=1 Tax=Dendropsophus ebraccatus TaxID=150705 RepID=UPI0038314225